jgi:hypothetical protein
MNTIVVAFASGEHEQHDCFEVSLDTPPSDWETLVRAFCYPKPNEVDTTFQLRDLTTGKAMQMTWAGFLGLIKERGYLRHGTIKFVWTVGLFNTGSRGDSNQFMYQNQISESGADKVIEKTMGVPLKYLQ